MGKTREVEKHIFLSNPTFVKVRVELRNEIVWIRLHGCLQSFFLELEMTCRHKKWRYRCKTWILIHFVGFDLRRNLVVLNDWLFTFLFSLACSFSIQKKFFWFDWPTRNCSFCSCFIPFEERPFVNKFIKCHSTFEIELLLLQMGSMEWKGFKLMIAINVTQHRYVTEEFN